MALTSAGGQYWHGDTGQGLCVSSQPHLFSSPGNGYVSARASPGLLPVANGNSLNKVIPAKSPPPPTHSAQLGAPSRKPDLRVITSQGGKGLMHHLVSGVWAERARGRGWKWRVDRGKSRPPAGETVTQQLGLPRRAQGSMMGETPRGPHTGWERRAPSLGGSRKGQRRARRFCDGGQGRCAITAARWVR